MRETDKDNYFKTLVEEEIEGFDKDIRWSLNLLHQYILYLKEQKEAIRRETAQKCAEIAENSCLKPPDGGSPTHEEIVDAEYAAHLIRAHFGLDE